MPLQYATSSLDYLRISDIDKQEGLKQIIIDLFFREYFIVLPRCTWIYPVSTTTYDYGTNYEAVDETSTQLVMTSFYPLILELESYKRQHSPHTDFSKGLGGP